MDHKITCSFGAGGVKAEEGCMACSGQPYFVAMCICDHDELELTAA
jgi:hypothetical protein